MLRIDGQEIAALPGQSLLDLVRQLGLDEDKLSLRPLAAKIAGEVFTLNYIPVREKELSSDRPSMRRAMEASGGEVRLLRYADSAGRDAYKRTAQFIVFLAMRQLWPNAVTKMNCTIGRSVYMSVSGAADFDAERLKARVSELVAEDIALLRRRVKLSDAVAYYSAQGQTDKARLLSWRSVDYFDEYAHGDFADYYYGEMMPSTGYLQVWDICAAREGFLFTYPDDRDPDQVAHHGDSPNFFNVCDEGERWGQLMEDSFAANRINLGVMIVDYRHPPTNNDIVMANWFLESGCPFVVVANKMDKLKKSELEPNLKTIREDLNLPDEVTIIPFSAEKGNGREDLVKHVLAAVKEK